MNRKYKYAFILSLALSTFMNVNAQVAEFEQWLSNPKGNLVEQPFAQKALTKDQTQNVCNLIGSMWFKSSAEKLRDEWGKMKLKNDTITLPCAVRVFGVRPADGYSLYISMHGGGRVPKEANDEQWMNQIYLYTPKEGVYVAPRAPWNDSDMWHKKGLDELLEKLIQCCVTFEGVNPDRVYLLGYSAGGDGVWRMAPRMADRWAASSMMAGHPGQSSQVNLRNLPYMIWMGENDSAYDRNKWAAVKGAVLDSLKAADPQGYIHETHILKGKGHWMDYQDSAAIDWMAQYRRNPYPKKVIWRQEKVTRPAFYWLSAPQNEMKRGMRVDVVCNQNVIDIQRCDYSSLTIYLHDMMVNLDKPVIIRYKNKVIFNKKVNRSIKTLYQTLNERNDFRYMFPAEVTVDLRKLK